MTTKGELELPATPLVPDLLFPEAPRWRAGQLWFSDMIAQRVCTAYPDGTVRKVAHFDEMPGGMGFLPDGTPLIVGIPSTRLFAIRNGHPEVYAELGDAAEGHLDDLAVAPDGTAYVGAIGQITPDMENSPPSGAIIRVAPNGTGSRDADNLVSCTVNSFH